MGGRPEISLQLGKESLAIFALESLCLYFHKLCLFFPE